MEDMKKEQLEVLNEAKGYCANVLHCIDTVVPELKGDKKDDTDEYLRMTVDGVNVALEMYNATRDLTPYFSLAISVSIAFWSISPLSILGSGALLMIVFWISQR